MAGSACVRPQELAFCEVDSEAQGQATQWGKESISFVPRGEAIPGLRRRDEKSAQRGRCEHEPGSGKTPANARDAVGRLFRWSLTKRPRRAGQLQERATATLPWVCCCLRPSVRPQYRPPPSSAFPTPVVPIETLWAWHVVAHAELTPSLPGPLPGLINGSWALSSADGFLVCGRDSVE